MTCWAMGVPGEPVRQYATGDTAPLLPEGWVAVETSGTGARCRISVDGTAIELIAVTVAERRAERWSDAKAYRDIAINGGCLTAFGRADSDEASRTFMLGARELAREALEAGVSSEISWKMADNSIVLLTPAQVLRMTREVGLYVAACHAAGQAIGLAMEAATTMAAIEAIDITAGYPAQEEI